MGTENDFCCEAVRKRHSENGTINKAVENGDSRRQEKKQAVAKEKKINKTQVTFFDFWYECIDWDMIKLFYALLMLFFCTVGLAVFLYLFYVFNFNEKLWYFYFPVTRRYGDRF